MNNRHDKAHIETLNTIVLHYKYYVIDNHYEYIGGILKENRKRLATGNVKISTKNHKKTPVKQEKTRHYALLKESDNNLYKLLYKINSEGDASNATYGVGKIKLTVKVMHLTLPMAWTKVLK